MTSTSTFDRWEKDPLFAAAEEVQEAADRMESIYRRWIYESKSHAKPAGGEGDASGELELRKELHAALGAAKWQLEVFDRASRSKNDVSSVDADARVRHSQFVSTIGNQLLTVENSLGGLEIEERGKPVVWVQLDEGERDELAMFLSCPQSSEEQKARPGAVVAGSCKGHRLPPLPYSSGGVRSEGKDLNGEVRIDLPKSSVVPAELDSRDNREEKKHGHRRAASLGVDLGFWNNSMSNDDCAQRSSVEWPDVAPPPKVLSFSGLASAAESTWKTKWVKNGFRKWRAGDQHHASESIPLQSNEFSRDLRTCYEKSKDCLSSCGDESYDKHVYGCIGAFQRLLQRSQYQIQYGRPVHVIFWLVLAFLLIGISLAFFS
ncbi:hypothetical protein Taro_027478 [Colocasia esculenta]|uniref:Syntaxin 6/10/61 N-terminal domain-containing protein n=1 Tax=Colocasia esculenta TaxID=4460 RepID=A0A843VI71_COLES|nr:hypothetical protein [Colocasia esculenta]